MIEIDFYLERKARDPQAKDSAYGLAGYSTKDSRYRDTLCFGSLSPRSLAATIPTENSLGHE